MRRRCLRCRKLIARGTYCRACAPYDSTAWRLIRRAVGVRDNWTCQRCGRVAVGVQAAVGHIRPYALGGSSEMNNLRWLCRECNSAERGAGMGANV